MRPLTDDLPKPLLSIKGKSLLQWHIEALSSAGIHQIVINHAWLGQKIESAFADGTQFGMNIRYSPEAKALETAGGIYKALPLLSPQDYFLVINGDVFCPDFPIQNLITRANVLRKNPGQILAHLIMVPNPSQHPTGDFYLQGSQISEQDSLDAEKLTFSGIGIYHRDLFKGLEADTPIKLAPLLRTAMQDNRVSGEKYFGPWHDVGTPQRLQELNVAYE
jgi:MurNAc alpha-1-phosphate uridylyltransferase